MNATLSSRTYSRKNCEQECESRIILEQCGCIMYFMPRIKSDVNICGPKDWKCYEINKNFIDLSLNSSFMCSCMPGCFGINYDTEISMARMLENGEGIREKLLREMPTEYRRRNMAILQVYYKETNFRSQNKGELIGFTEFLCKCSQWSSLSHHG